MSAWRKVGCCLAAVAGMMSANAFSDDWIEADGLVECIARGDGSRAYVFTNGTVAATLKTQLLATQYLVVGGGGCGGSTMGGGGGGGGVVYNDAVSLVLNTGDTFVSTVGAGGLNGTLVDYSVSGLNGGDSELRICGASIPAAGGGGGGSWQPGNARDGASGGGSARSCTPGKGVSGQGFAGGMGYGTNAYGSGGGGGGASEPGDPSSVENKKAGKGGEGRSISITGTPVVYGSGGGGGGNNTTSFGKHDPNVGGTNAGDGAKDGNGGKGVDGTGGGGGGGGWGSSYFGGIGGCGTVIVVLEPPSEDLEIETPYAVSVAPDGATVNVKIPGIGAGATSVTVTYRYGTDQDNLDRSVVVAENLGNPGIVGATLSGLEPFSTWYLKAVSVNDRGDEVESGVISFRAEPVYEDEMVCADDDTFYRTPLAGGAFAYVFTNVSVTAKLRVKGDYTMSEWLVVGGGGGGGHTMGGGGGGGGVIHEDSRPRRCADGTGLVVSVGAGGKYGSVGHNDDNTNGGDSVLTINGEDMTAHGGGGGGSFDQVDISGAGRSSYGYGRDGGSGGGSTRKAPGGAAVIGQGNPGGSGLVADIGDAAGGGGAGEPGASPDTATKTSGKGGEGLEIAIAGTPVVYGSGGGGGGSTNGYGGYKAGDGGTNAGDGGRDTFGGNGTDGTGGGGGGGGRGTNTQRGGWGGSGTVIFVLEPTDDTLRVAPPHVEKIEADGVTVSVKVGGLGAGAGSAKVTCRYGVDPDDLDRTLVLAESIDDPKTVRAKLADVNPAFTWYLVAEVENDLRERVTSSPTAFTTRGAYLRFTFTGGSTMCQLSELAFYDAETNRIDTVAARTNDAVAAVDLAPGHWTLSKALGTSDAESPANLFDGNVNTKQYVTGNGDFPYTYTFRFAKERPPALYNLATADEHHERSPTAWTIELSRDGIAWETVEQRSGVSSPDTAFTWFAGADTPWAFATDFTWARFVLGTVAPQEYRGAPVEPKVSVRSEADGKLLEEGDDYTLSYENNRGRGTATVVVTGVNDYAGAHGRVDFAITTPTMTVTAETRAVLDSDEPPYTTAVTVRDAESGATLVEGTDYVLVYSNNMAVGLGEVRVVGTNGYEFADAVAAKFAICGIVRVAPDAAAGGSGRSWDSPMRFMDALEAMRIPGGVMWLKKGTYTDVAMSASLVVSNILSVVGGFAGTETSADQRPAGAVSTIDGGNARDLLRLENVAGADLAFERIVFTRAKVRALYKGGEGDLTVSGCVFRANGYNAGKTPQYAADGRGIYVDGAGVTKVRIVDTDFCWQHASGSNWQGSGMGAYVKGCASLTLEHCLFATNGISLNTPSADFTGVFSGAAICILSTPVCATNCRFAGNVAGICGVSGYAINGNTDGADGGAVFIDGTCGGSVFRNCAFVGNADWMSTKNNLYGAMKYGGAVMVNMKNASDTIEFQNCTIAYNLSQGMTSPGGLNIVRGTVTLRDSIVYGNIRGYIDTKVGGDIDVKANGRLSVAYSLLTSTNSTEVSTASAGNLSVDSATVLTGDPAFVTTPDEVAEVVVRDANFYRYFDPAATTYAKIGTFDVHLKSIGGYAVNGGGLGPSVTETSVMLDKGDPAAPCASEREPNGNRVNAGAYGNTAEASMTPDGEVAIGTVVADTEADPGTAVFTIPLVGDETYLADVWFCFDYTVPSGDGTNGWAWVLDAGRMRLPGETLTVDLGRNGLYFSRNEKLRWRVVAKTAYGTARADGETTIPYDQGAAVPAVADLSSPDYDNDVGTAVYTFRLGGVGRYEADVYICSGGTPGEGTNGWKEVNLVRTGCARGDELTAPIGNYFDKDETCLWRIVVVVDGEVAATRDGSVTGVYDCPPIKGKHGPKYVVHLRAGAEGDASGRDWYNACATVADALSVLAADATKREVWIAGDLSAGAGTTSVLLDRPCMIRGGFTTFEEQSPEDRTAGARSVIRNPSNSARELVRTKTSASFGCDGIEFVGARGNAAYVDASGTDSVITFTNCGFMVNSRLYAAGGGEVTFAMGGCEFRGCIQESGSGSALGVSSCAWAEIADTQFVTNGIAFAQLLCATDRDTADACFVAKFSNTPTRLLRCSFIGGKATGHNYAQFHSVVGLYGNCGGSELRNCLFAANGFTTANDAAIGDIYSAPLVLSFGAVSQAVLVENCTFAYNFYNNLSGCAGISLNKCAATIRNSVFFGNFHTETSAADLKLFGGATADISYSLFEATNAEHIAVSSGSVAFGKGILLGDPKFFTGLDYARAHMTSCEVGRTVIPKGSSSLLTNAADCVTMDLHLSGTYRGGDGVTHRSGGVQSPAVNAGDKASAYDREPQPNGGRVNLGNYGNTPEATMSKIGTVLFVK